MESVHYKHYRRGQEKATDIYRRLEKQVKQEDINAFTKGLALERASFNITLGNVEALYRHLNSEYAKYLDNPDRYIYTPYFAKQVIPEDTPVTLPVDAASVTFQLDDGSKVRFPRDLLVFFTTLANSIEDIGYENGTVVPLHNISQPDLTWLVNFYRAYRKYLIQENIEEKGGPLSAKQMTRFKSEIEGGTIDKHFESMELTWLLNMYQFADYNDSKPVMSAMTDTIVTRLIDPDVSLDSLGVSTLQLIALEDMGFGTDELLLLEYMLQVSNYTARYRQILTILRGRNLLNVSELVASFPRPSLQPFVHTKQMSLVFTTYPVFKAYGAVFRGLSGAQTLEEAGLIGDIISIAEAENHMMIITTDGLYATGLNDVGQLGLGDATKHSVLDFRRVPVPGVPLLVACSKDSSVVATTEGVYVAGQIGKQYQSSVFVDITYGIDSLVLIKPGPLNIQFLTRSGSRIIVEKPKSKDRSWKMSGAKDIRVVRNWETNIKTSIIMTKDSLFERKMFQKEETMILGPDSGLGRPLSFGLVGNSALIITTEGLFAAPPNDSSNALGLGDRYFVPVSISGKPLYLVTTEQNSLLLTTTGLYLAGTDDREMIGSETYKTFTLVPITSELPLPLLKGELDLTATKTFCHLCNNTAKLEECLQPDRVFCSSFCLERYHRFAQSLHFEPM